MDKFKYFNNQYFCDFSKSNMQEEPATIEKLRIAESTLRNKQQEQDLYNLFQFIKIWKDKYDLFCHEFKCYTYTGPRIPVRSCNSPIEECGYLLLPKVEFYIDEFFNMILNKRAKFEIQQYLQNYNPEYDKVGRIYEYTKQPDKNIIISGNKFTMIGKDNTYRLDIKMNAALICSILSALSNNYIIYDWYSKQSRFKEFIDTLSNKAYYLTFDVGKRSTRVNIRGQETMTIDIDSELHWFYIVYNDEVVRVENKIYYSHLDKIFGKDRTKQLTEEDIQLYSILNNGNKPLMYDFEY